VIEIVGVAAALGLVFNATPGAVFTESLRRGMHGGFRPAFAVQAGSLAGDAVWAVLGLAGVGGLMMLPAVRVPLTVVGCLVLAALGVQALRGGGDAAPTQAQAGALAAGAAMSLGNPWNVVYWSGTAGAVAALVGTSPTVAQLTAFLAGFMAASIAWCVVCAGGIALLRRALPPVALRIVEVLCGVVLLVLAGLLLVRALTA
jgi:chemosensory pili system protein ChpE